MTYTVRNEDGNDAPSDVRIRALAPVDWRDLKAVRLEALSDSPHAFLSAGGDESTWTDDAWRRTFQTGMWVVAAAGLRIVGLARMSRAGSEPPHIEAVWTHPHHRGRGIASALVQWLIAWEQRSGATEILIWVIEPNRAARGLYESLGFEPTGERQSLGSAGERVEERLRLPIEEQSGRW
jgi:GNAT superfamily N-acetyltransferase